jgi:transketolase
VGFARAGARHPDRVINVGIREQLLIGVAGGLALTGFRPIAHSYTPFLVERPFEQVKLDLGHNDVGAVLVSIGASYDAAGEGRTHQAPEDVTLIASLPDWTIHVPGHPDEAEHLLRVAARDDGRVYVRLAARSNAAARAVEPGRLHVESRGAGPTVIAVGPMLDRVLEAVDGLDATVLYATTVRPFDEDTLRAELRSTEIVLVEPYLQGTSSAVVTDAVRTTPHRLLALGVRPIENRHYGTPDEHDLAHGLDSVGLRRQIESFLEPPGR